MQQSTFNLGPGALRGPAGSPFTITPDQWRSIDAFLDNVNSTGAETTARFVKLMPAYAKLKQSAATWKASTFPGLIGLARGIIEYNQATVQQSYPELDTLAGAWQTRAATADEVARFNTIITDGNARAQRNATAAQAIVHDLDSLTEAVKETNDQSQTAIATALAGGAGGAGPGGQTDQIVALIGQIAQGLSQLAAIQSVLGTPPVLDIERVRGAWGATSDDLGGLKTWIMSAIDSREPFLAQLNIEAAISEWQTLAGEAGSFIQNATS